jgi:hypothetical protein
MFAKSFLSLAACLTLLSACSDGSTAPSAGAGGSGGGHDAGIGGASGAEPLIIPEGVTVSPTPGGNGVFNVIALTLRQGTSGAELYAAVKNEGDEKGCSPAFTVEIFDKTEQMLAVGVSGLLVQSFFRLTDGSSTIAACVAPGEVSMVAIKGLPPDLRLDDVGRIAYRLNYWNLDAVPIAGVNINDVQPVMLDAGVGYAGTFVNGFDVSMDSPSVNVFPINRVGRPLGVAVGRRSAELAPADSWEFETDTVTETGVDQVAFPASGPKAQ